ncbi:hypothetical protein [Streptacidiphilus sp. EB129]|uniref:hypothetical protein n=1 Tax=Streptacidiphilus sp. EB129 TaxID=3156262 RepID=UPI0035143391
MGDSVLNIVLGVVSSVFSAGLAWALQAVLRRRKLDRRRRFFGLYPGTESRLVVPRKAGSSVSQRVIAQRDVYALMELAALVRDCGAEAEIVSHDEVQQGLGDKAEFCIGGPVANERTAAHLRWKLPGIAVTAEWEAGINELTVGDRSYVREIGKADHAVLGRIAAGEGERPTFLICGQTATANLAAVRYLTRHHRDLIRRYSPEDSFCLLLRVIQPDAYGADVVELLGDVTEQASTPRPAPNPSASPAA